MTREEAIRLLSGLMFKGKLKEALDMAISALEHPERNVVAVVPCGDAISRSDVLKLMQDNWHTHNGDWAMQESMDDIRVLPSVTPQEPKTGHWIWCVGSHKCSNCEEYTCFSHKELLRYCPNCGAKMVEPQESER